ncbi:MAG: hypothetical protein ACOYL6_15975 [Bacteriovoracaceae bacterium]
MLKVNLVLSLLLLVSSNSWSNSSTTTFSQEKDIMSSVREKIGLNYFNFWDGPGVSGLDTITPNELGKPNDDGLSLWNLTSIRYKFSKDIALDLQNRMQFIHTEKRDSRFQGLRVGVSGLLAQGEIWKINGAVNTDVPEANGYIAQQRATIFNPGTFANLTVKPKDSRFSVFAILSPRFFFYSDKEAVEPQWKRAGRSPGQKPEFIMAASPTLNYALTDKLGLRTGVDLSFRKLMQDEWGSFRRWPSSWSTGFTYDFNKYLSIYPYVMTYPFDGKGLSQETTSLGMWMSGTIL